MPLVDGSAIQGGLIVRKYGLSHVMSRLTEELRHHPLELIITFWADIDNGYGEESFVEKSVYADLFYRVPCDARLYHCRHSRVGPGCAIRVASYEFGRPYDGLSSHSYFRDWVLRQVENLVRKQQPSVSVDEQVSRTFEEPLSSIVQAAAETSQLQSGSPSEETQG